MALPIQGRNRGPTIAGRLGILLLLLTACGTQQPAGVPAAPPSSPNTTESAALPPPALAPPPLIARIAPSASPGSPVPSPAGSQGYSSELTTTATPTPIPQTAALKLEVNSPRDNAVVSSPTITVAGLTSPDAAVSVNGRLVTPDPDGRFAADLSVTLADNPLPIEVIATSISGEQRWLVLTVIYIP